jgi:branched-chain amino acid aminotransferase
MSQYVLLNGETVEAGRGGVSVDDGGLLHGAGLFETIRAYQGVPFRYEQHLERMLRSAKTLDLPITADILPGRDEVCALAAKNALLSARVRLTVTAGPLSAAAGDDGPQPTVLLTAAAMPPYPPELYTEGMTVLISAYRQSRYDPLCGHKTTAYFARLCALREAQRQDCAEALWFTTENLLAEGSISNVFVVKDQKVKTPPVDTPVLPGVTRAAALELARDANIITQELPLTLADLLEADEVFVTNAGFEVVPVVRVERKPIADEKPGVVSQALLERYRAAVEREIVCRL